MDALFSIQVTTDGIYLHSTLQSVLNKILAALNRIITLDAYSAPHVMDGIG